MDHVIVLRHDRAAIRRFRRTMRRHEARAARTGLPATREHLRALRLDPHPDHVRDVRTIAEGLREGSRVGRQSAFVFARAVDAATKLRAALTEDV